MNKKILTTTNFSCFLNNLQCLVKTLYNNNGQTSNLVNIVTFCIMTLETNICLHENV